MIVFQAGKDICKSTIRKKPVQSQENSVISIDYEHMFAFWTRKIIEICSTLTIKTSVRPLVNRYRGPFSLTLNKCHILV